jgi:hypothetical protein
LLGLGQYEAAFRENSVTVVTGSLFALDVDVPGAAAFRAKV